MIDRETGKTARKVAKKALELEFRSEPGRLNALGMVLVFVLIVLAGAQSGVEAAIATLFGDDSQTEFPWLPAIGALVGCILLCVLFLGMLRLLVPGGKIDEE